MLIPKNTNEKKHIIVVAITGNKCDGYIRAYLTNNLNTNVYIDFVSVHNNSRGKKLCSSMLSDLIKYVSIKFPNVFTFTLLDVSANIKNIVNNTHIDFKSGLTIGDKCYTKTMNNHNFYKYNSENIYPLSIYVRLDKIEHLNKFLKSKNFY